MYDTLRVIRVGFCSMGFLPFPASESNCAFLFQLPNYGLARDSFRKIRAPGA